MNAEIISIGTELLLGNIVNTNTRDLSLMLADLGINVFWHSTVGDNPARLRESLLLAKELIDGGMRATEACYQCGFHSYSSFYRSYSKHLGTTPTGRIDAHRAKPIDFE